MRRGELWLLPIVAAGIVIAALIGQRVAPSESLLDARRSTLLEGPDGAKGLAAALEKFAVAVEKRRRPLFDWGSDSSRVELGAVLALLDVSIAPTSVEQRVLRNAVARGGKLFLAGRNAVERCFAHRVRRLGGETEDTAVTVELPSGIHALPAVRAIVERIPNDSLYRDETDVEACPVLFPIGVDTLLRTRGGRGQAIATRLTFRSGGSVMILADSRLLSNRALKETDAGIMVIPWMLQGLPERIVFDEYHHGFQERRSILLAAWNWSRNSPAGWAIWQLCVAGLLSLAFFAVRFGPALNVIERKRRSPMEHLDALAAGLQRAEGQETAVMLIAAGLRRRLGRTGTVRRGDRGLSDWLDALELAVPTPEARSRVERLGRLVGEPGGEERVLQTASAVEDVWEALGQESKRTRS